jgi:hypothetical protein
MAESDSQREPDPLCPICLLPIKPDDSVRFEHGEVIHVECSVEKKKRAEKPTDR